ncbi:MAG TPA: hypothetical protein VFE35_07090 [Candidatus Cybelea sp.]|jgi:D-alanyl-D-alanine carboxypeptidase|nr:hypothetical protein [Candidatus Cybelea sp.]
MDRHSGESFGYTSEVFYLPAQAATIVVLVNSNVSPNRGTAADALLHALTRVVTPNNVTSSEERCHGVERPRFSMP